MIDDTYLRLIAPVCMIFHMSPDEISSTLTLEGLLAYSKIAGEYQRVVSGGISYQYLLGTLAEHCRKSADTSPAAQYNNQHLATNAADNSGVDVRGFREAFPNCFVDEVK